MGHVGDSECNVFIVGKEVLSAHKTLILSPLYFTYDIILRNQEWLHSHKQDVHLKTYDIRIKNNNVPYHKKPFLEYCQTHVLCIVIGFIIC